MKMRKIPIDNLGMVAYYLLQITQGIFKWNGELFFVPFITLEDKKYPLRPSTWKKIMKSGKNALPWICDEIVCLYADPVDPVTYTRTHHRVMDMSMGISRIWNDLVVLKGNGKMIIKNGYRVDTLEFVRKISDAERRLIFNPKDQEEMECRVGIWKSSKLGEHSYKGRNRNYWVKRYQEHRQQAVM